MTFDEMLDNYAAIIIGHGANVQEGQLVNIGTEVYHRDFALRLATAAYERGAAHVNLDLIEPRLHRVRIQHSSREQLEYVPGFTGVKYQELLDTAAANIRITGSEYPDVLADLDTGKINAARKAQYMAVKHFYEEGIEKSKVHWTVAAAATPAWGLKIFPGEAPETAERRLWEEIFRICRADRDDWAAAWSQHNRGLQGRAAALTAMGIRSLRFTGPGTDLTVGLSSRAVFRGGTDTGPRGVDFEPNLPTEECFTTPDWRLTEGRVRTTRPFLINGKLIKGLTAEFREGRIVDFAAEDGADTFREYIASDDGARRLGEVALVGIDSPVYRSGLVFEEILYDENAACHVAIGSAYKFCLDGGEAMSEAELEAIGCNVSCVHTDMMISSDQVDVAARLADGGETPLIGRGEWLLPSA